MTTPFGIDEQNIIRDSAHASVTRMLIAQYGHADQFTPGFFRVGILGEGKKEGVYCIKSNTLILHVKYDEIIKGAVDTECIVRVGELWGIFSLKDGKFVYPLECGAHQIRALPEGQISVTSTVRSLYAVLTESRWCVYNTTNGITTAIA